MPLKLVAMAQFKEPVIANLNVIVPATVLINPSVINANVTTPITVTVLDADGVIPQPGVNVWAEGLDYATTPVMTNASGVAVITVNYPYGPTLDIVGKRPADSYRLFTEQVEVNALALTTPDLTVTTAIGMDDAFPLNLPGTLHAVVGEPGCTLYAQMPDGSLLQSATSTLTATATETGNVVGMIAKSGYDLYTETFAVIEAYGTVAGTVTSGGNPLAGVIVRCLDENDAQVFSVTTNASGAWTAPEEILVDNYTLVVDHFGYLHLGQPVFVNYGANTFPLVLTPAPSGVLSGHIYDSVTLLPLQGSVKVYRADTGVLYTETVSDASGYYATSPLPYFTYSVRVRATHHSPVVSTVTMEEPAVEKDWLLDPTAGDLLLIDDEAKSATYAEDKFDGKDNRLESAGYLAEPSKSVAELTTDLENLGYGVTVVDQATADPATFVNYDLVILSCGTNTVTLANTALKTGLVAFARAGGHILLEGGELGYDQYGSGDFATYVMHTNDWNHDSSGNIQVNANATHAVATTPNNLAGTTIGLTYSVYGDADAMAPLADARTVAVWTTYTTDASVIAYDPNPAPFGGQIVFFCFNYSAAAAPAREQLLENAVVYLLTEELGNCAVSGTVLPAGRVQPQRRHRHGDAQRRHHDDGGGRVLHAVRPLRRPVHHHGDEEQLVVRCRAGHPDRRSAPVRRRLPAHPDDDLGVLRVAGGPDQRQPDHDRHPDHPGCGRRADHLRRGLRQHHPHLHRRPAHHADLAGRHAGGPAQPLRRRHGQPGGLVPEPADARGQPRPVRRPADGGQLDPDRGRPGRRRRRHPQPVVPAHRPRLRPDHAGGGPADGVQGLRQLPEPLQPADDHPLRPAADHGRQPAHLRRLRTPRVHAGRRGPARPPATAWTGTARTTPAAASPAACTTTVSTRVRTRPPRR